MAKKRVVGRNQNARRNRDNRANQLNPNNNAYWKARGHDKRPSNRNNVSSRRKNSD